MLTHNQISKAVFGREVSLPALLQRLSFAEKSKAFNTIIENYDLKFWFMSQGQFAISNL